MFFVEELKQNLNREKWVDANQRLLAKMIAEYMYEDMIYPEQVEGNTYLLKIGEWIPYRFQAEPRLFNSYSVDCKTIEKYSNNNWEPADSAVQFILDIQQSIGMSAETAGHLIKELNATLLADVNLMVNHTKSADELAELGYEELEGEMTGHPWITYNKGRIGFGYDDYLMYAPENQQKVQLSWIAVKKEKASYQSVAGANYDSLLKSELDQETLHSFHERLAAEGCDHSQYFYMPVHEWQWKNVIIQNFAHELAAKIIVPLGDGPDQYLPQQSIRTFVNTSQKMKQHVKLPMSILNTLVYRGLPAERTVIAPKITEFIKGIADQDRFLKEECRVILPGENASINVDQYHFSELKGAPYQYLEMLGVIWRESIHMYTEEGERPITLAALAHADASGKPYVQSLMEKSGLSPEEWIRQMFHVVMPPLLHYLYQYGTVFSPHGQNTILVLKKYKPHRLAIKDFVDDVNISDQPFAELESLAQELKAVLRSEPPEGLTQFIFTGLFICHLRYLADLLVKNDLLKETSFWRLLAEEIYAYQDRFPHLQERFALFDFFQPELTKLCLNRNRMVDYGYGDGEDRPHASEFGKVSNALHLFAREEVSS
ncbi:Siderophore synthetase component [Fictibacillus enclensis]|uniref:Iron transporter n=1 Tax=Fictibacillus enclensis TaxID=1017270 RepID=A0A0V8JCK6_9BACL|nr:IucA/IucC family siderophore biosynthesis protein [Fictibacillus enclensis]KSU84650.1 iron transporter [Fictibacillus enclensis]SCB83035.1 Siderophore synthetase component [Fictibacillus enclensis]